MVPIFVLNRIGRRATYEISLQDSVRSLKEAIEEKEGIQAGMGVKLLMLVTDIDIIRWQFPGRQGFKYNGEELLDDRTFDSYGISKDNVIDLSLQWPIKVLIKTLTGKTTVCFIDPDESVWALKIFIQDIEGIPPSMSFVTNFLQRLFSCI